MYKRFSQLVKRRAKPGYSQFEFSKLERAYTEPHRHYHTLAHVAWCLEWFDRYSALARFPDAVELAIWYHDIVYQPTKPDNEIMSAEAFMHFAGMAHVSDDVSHLVFRTILASTHMKEDFFDDPDCKLMLDLDLISLSFPWEEFVRANEQIRKEYSHVPENDYCVRKVLFFQSLLDRKQLYYTDVIRANHEEVARHNIQAAIEMLRS